MVRTMEIGNAHWVRATITIGVTVMVTIWVILPVTFMVEEIMIELLRIKAAITELKSAMEEQGMILERILVDKTLPITYELKTGRSYNEEPRTPTDPFDTFVVSGVTIVGRDNEQIRNHKQWPEGE